MIPGVIVPLDRFPLTTNGKVDRKALPAPEGLAERAPYEAPVTSTEQMLGSIWSEVLQREPVGRSDNFFELGGNSIRAVQLIARMRLAFGCEIPFRAVLEAENLQMLGAYVDTFILLTTEQSTRSSDDAAEYEAGTL